MKMYLFIADHFSLLSLASSGLLNHRLHFHLNWLGCVHGVGIGEEVSGWSRSVNFGLKYGGFTVDRGA